MTDIYHLADDLEASAKRQLERLANYTSTDIALGLLDAEYAGEKDVDTEYKVDGLHAEITANGKSVAFIEFGTGIQNISGTSVQEANITTPPPVPLGTYGQGNGSHWYGWWYRGVKGSNPPPGTEDAIRYKADGSSKVRYGVVHTYGNPPATVFYNARKKLMEEAKDFVNDILFGVRNAWW